MCWAYAFFFCNGLGFGGIIYIACCYQAPDATNCSPVPAPLAAAEQQRQLQRPLQRRLGAQRPRAERQLPPREPLTHFLEECQNLCLSPREPLTHFLEECQNLCWRLLRGLSVGVGGARTNTAGRQCVLSCASAYSRVRRGARQRETDNGILREDLIGRDTIIFTYLIYVIGI